MSAPHSHRPTTKHKQKRFKSGHASSRTLNNISKGKIQAEKTPGTIVKVHTKKDRRNLAKQIQQNKKNALKAQVGFFGDGRNKASRICALISLSQSINPKWFVNGLQEHLSEPVTDTADTSIHIKNFKQRLQFVTPKANTLTSHLDVAAIADYTIFLISGSETLAQNHASQELLRAFQSQGISSHISVIPDLKYDPDSMIERTDKRCDEIRKTWEADLGRYFPVHHSTSLYVMDSQTELVNMLRSICTGAPDSPSWRSSRSYIVPTLCNFDEQGKFVVEGILRGGSLSADRTMHIPSYGDFCIDKICSAPNGIEEERILAEPTDAQDSFIAAEADMDMDVPSADDLTAREQLRRGVRLDDYYYLDDGEEEVEVQKKLPKGTSEYQATWITEDITLNSDEEAESTDEALNGDDSDDAMSVGTQPAPSTYAPTQVEEAHQELSEEEEARQLAVYRSQVKEDQEFPDEVDFDPSVSARDRFRKYRGLKSFRQSEWDAEEIETNTPHWYRQIRKFANYSSTRNRILKTRGSVQMGTRVKLYLSDVPLSIMEDQDLPVVWANREHEQAKSINNFSIQLEPDVEPIKSKSDVIVQVAHRRFSAQVVFSQAIPKTGNGLVRYERFCQPGRISYATIACPTIMEKGVPVMYFLPSESDPTQLKLIGTGSFAGVDHSRLTIKRILLSGVPFKIHKKLVTIRYMFHSREDVQYFKAIQLTSKYGRTGYIKEPLGTHGYMKTTWDKKLQGVDTVLMPLYKRIYPREATYYKP